MNRIWISSGCLLLAMAGAACGDDDRMMMETDAGPGDDAGMRIDAGRRPDASTMDSGMTGDGNDSFETAADVPLGTDGVAGEIDPPGDHDFYKFDGTAGQWVSISTEANPDDDPEMIDTVLTLYDASMTQIAENDDAVPRASTDSEIIIHLPADGTYYVEVQEFSDWADETPEGDPSFAYTLTVFEVSGDAPAVTLDPETGDDMASAETMKFSMDFGLVVGTFDDETDVDVYSLNIAGSSTMSFSVDLMPDGTDGYGSTTPAGEVWVTSMDGSTILARVDQSMGFTGINPSLAPGDYLVWVAHPGGTAGENDFYVGKAFRGMENPLEATPDANDTLLTAEAITQTMAMDSDRRSGFILSHLTLLTDVDYFSFDVADGEVVSIACGSASEGSGVQGLTAEIRDSTDTVVDTQTETVPDGIFFDEVSVAAAGTYYLRLSKTGQDAEVTGDFVRCGIHVAPPAAP